MMIFNFCYHVNQDDVQDNVVHTRARPVSCKLQERSASASALLQGIVHGANLAALVADEQL
jgi:hypothetical protein